MGSPLIGVAKRRTCARIYSISLSLVGRCQVVTLSSPNTRLDLEPPFSSSLFFLPQARYPPSHVPSPSPVPVPSPIHPWGHNHDHSDPNSPSPITSIDMWRRHGPPGSNPTSCRVPHRRRRRRSRKGIRPAERERKWASSCCVEQRTSALQCVRSLGSLVYPPTSSLMLHGAGA